MKRFLMLLCVLLLIAAAAVAEDAVCTHPNMKKQEREVQYCQEQEGHYIMKIAESICEDCGAHAENTFVGPFTGHVFCMAENLHLQHADYHICIFICQDCHILALWDNECDGYDECDSYHAQEGETPPVQILYSLENWYEEYSEEAVIARWLEKQPTE